MYVCMSTSKCAYLKVSVRLHLEVQFLSHTHTIDAHMLCLRQFYKQTKDAHTPRPYRKQVDIDMDVFIYIYVYNRAQAEALSRAADEAETASALKKELAKAREEAATQVSLCIQEFGYVCGMCLGSIGMCAEACFNLHTERARTQDDVSVFVRVIGSTSLPM
jgi:hypothetical protein